MHAPSSKLDSALSPTTPLRPEFIPFDAEDLFRNRTKLSQAMRQLPTYEQSLVLTAIRIHNDQVSSVFLTMSGSVGWGCKLKGICQALFPHRKIRFLFINGKEPYELNETDLRCLQKRVCDLGLSYRAKDVWPALNTLKYGPEKKLRESRLLTGYWSTKERFGESYGYWSWGPASRTLLSRIDLLSGQKIHRYLILDEQEETGATARNAEARLALLLAPNPNAIHVGSMYVSSRHGFVNDDPMFYGSTGFRLSSANNNHRVLAKIPNAKSKAMLKERLLRGREIGQAIRNAADPDKIRSWDLTIDEIHLHSLPEDGNRIAAMQASHTGQSLNLLLRDLRSWSERDPLSLAFFGATSGVVPQLTDMLCHPELWGISAQQVTQIEHEMLGILEGSNRLAAWFFGSRFKDCAKLNDFSGADPKLRSFLINWETNKSSNIAEALSWLQEWCTRNPPTGSSTQIDGRLVSDSEQRRMLIETLKAAI